MASKLTIRTCQPPGREAEVALRAAVDQFNEGRSWTLHLDEDPRDRHLVGRMQPHDVTESPHGGLVPFWPGPYEAQCLLELLSGLSRDGLADWELHDHYGLRPVGYIRAGVCHADAKAQAEAARNMGEVLRRRHGA